jgi:hypothetical protein
MLKYDATWTLRFQASFSDDANSVNWQRLNSLLKKLGFKRGKTMPGNVTWSKADVAPVKATEIMQKVFEAHKAFRKVTHIQKLILRAEPKYKPITFQA